MTSSLGTGGSPPGRSKNPLTLGAGLSVVSWTEANICAALISLVLALPSHETSLMLSFAKLSSIVRSGYRKAELIELRLFAGILEISRPIEF